MSSVAWRATDRPRKCCKSALAALTSYPRWLPTTNMFRRKPCSAWSNSRAKQRPCFAIPPGPNRWSRISAALRPKPKSAASEPVPLEARHRRYWPGLAKLHAVGIDHFDAHLGLCGRHIAEMEARILAE